MKKAYLAGAFWVLLFLFLCVRSAHAGVASYVVSAGAGAFFLAGVGIVPSQVTPTFTPTVASTAVTMSRSIPVSVATPYGAATGAVNLAGDIALPIAIVAAKAYAGSNPYVRAGSALYAAYQAYGFIPDSSGSFGKSPSGFAPAGKIYSLTGSNVPAAGVDFSFASAIMSHFPYPGVYVVNVGDNFSLIYPGQSVVWNGYAPSFLLDLHSGYTSPAPPPNTPLVSSDTAAAVDSFVNTGSISTDAAHVASLLRDMPYTAYVPPVAGSPASDLVTPWGVFSRTYDAAGNQVVTSKQMDINISPTSGANINAPLAVQVTENTQTTTNGVITGSSSAAAASAAPGTSADPSLAPSSSNAAAAAAQPAVAAAAAAAANATPPPADLAALKASVDAVKASIDANTLTKFCTDNPLNTACSDLSQVDFPSDTLKENNVDVGSAFSSAVGAFTFSGGGSCPADHVIGLHNSPAQIVISWASLCQYIGWFRLAILAVASFVCAMIIMGQRASDSRG